MSLPQTEESPIVNRKNIKNVESMQSLVSLQNAQVLKILEIVRIISPQLLRSDAIKYEEGWLIFFDLY